MDLRTYVGILSKNRLLIALVTLACVGVAMLVYVRTPPTFAATVQFYVSTPLSDGMNAQSAGQFAQNRVNSYVEIMSSEELATRIIATTGVDLSPGQVAARVSASGDVSTVLMTATVTDTDKERALLIAQGVALTFGKLVDDLDNQGREDAIVVINIVSGPSLRPNPIAPDLRLHLLIGLLAGLLGTATYAVLREVLNTSIRNSTEAQRLLQLPVIGSIPYDSNARKSPLIVDDQALSVRAEAYRKVRTNLQFIDAAQTADVILITSAEPQEGKSVTAINLALSLSELGRRTLIIDADMRKPKASEYLDVDNDIGLSNVLAGQLDATEAIREFGREGMFVLPAGSIPPNPSELLGSFKMQALMESLRPEYDHIVLDTPPILPVTDAVVASGLVDAVVLVVAAGKTARGAVQHAVAALQAVNAPLVGVLINKSKEHGGDRQYYASYGTTSDRSVVNQARKLRQRLRNTSASADADDFPSSSHEEQNDEQKTNQAQT